MNNRSLRTWAEINHDALQHNVRALRSLCAADTSLMGVVKADAYGHGIAQVVPAIAPWVDWFGVANLSEALEVRALGVRQPVMILGPALPSERSEIRAHGFVPVVSSVDEASAFAAPQGAAPFGVHLAVDTGMGRIGVWETEALEVARGIGALPGVVLAGVGSHFPVADEDDAFTHAQTLRFSRLVSELRSAGLVRGPAHIANSAGLIRHRQSGFDLCRTGLALYGVSPVVDFQADLRPVLSWKSRVSLVREVRAGRGISYGRTFVAPRDMRVATLALGYADGYQRHLSNRGAGVLIGGKWCPLLGRVTMDQILVDVSDSPTVVPGEEAVLIGGQGNAQILATQLAEWAGTIPWEIFTGLGRRVERCGVWDSASI